MTPMMEQYFEIKNQYKDYLLFYRLGDFYEMFFDDARIAARELELTLTGRDCGEAERAPMCGVPFHSAESYIGRLIEKGYKVAICEQMEDPATAKGLVKREIVRVVTPGTLLEPSMLTESRNNYVCAVSAAGDAIGLSVCRCFHRRDLSYGIVRGKQAVPASKRAFHLFSQRSDCQQRSFFAEGDERVYPEPDRRHAGGRRSPFLSFACP